MFIMELPDVLMWRETQEYVKAVQEIWKVYGDVQNQPDLTIHMENQYILDKIQTKKEFIRRIEDYAANSSLTWQGQMSSHCAVMFRNDIDIALRSGTCESGEAKHYLMESMAQSWAFHIEDYAKAVNTCDGQYILELATGAGLGTWAVLKEFPPSSRLLSIDIDFACTRNADGLAQFFNIANRVAGLPANFWFLPFADETFDCACTHYGLDESREMPTILQEVARLLKPGGRFIVFARKNPYDRQQRFMSLFGIDADECNPLLYKARLYSGPDNLIAVAQHYGLAVVDKIVYKPETGHHRVLIAFKK